MSGLPPHDHLSQRLNRRSGPISGPTRLPQTANIGFDRPGTALWGRPLLIQHLSVHPARAVALGERWQQATVPSARLPTRPRSRGEGPLQCDLAPQGTLLWDWHCGNAGTGQRLHNAPTQPCVRPCGTDAASSPVQQPSRQFATELVSGRSPSCDQPPLGQGQEDADGRSLFGSGSELCSISSRRLRWALIPGFTDSKDASRVFSRMDVGDERHGDIQDLRQSSCG